jgi:hypothetical protein
MGPAIPRIGEYTLHVGEYVIPADGRRANRKVPRNRVVESVERVREVRAGTGKPTITYRGSGFAFVPVPPGFLSGASLGVLVRRHKFPRVHIAEHFE